MYNHWHEQITKACKNCGTMFTAPRWHNKDYCGVYCRKRAKRDRASERSAGAIKTVAAETLERFLTVLDSPTTTELDSWSQALITYPNDSKPILVRGNIPMWIAPEGTKIVPQPDGTWIIFKWQPSALDSLLNT